MIESDCRETKKKGFSYKMYRRTRVAYTLTVQLSRKTLLVSVGLNASSANVNSQFSWHFKIFAQPRKK